MLDSQPTKPWYREPWPWILMSGPATAVIAGIVTAFIAIAHDDPLVVDNYYKEGLAINRVLERDQAAAQGAYRAQVLFAEQGTAVRIHLTAEGRTLPDTLQLRAIHPTRAELDRTTALRATQAGWYEGVVDTGAAPRWRLQLEGEQRDWRLTGEWHKADGNAVVLEPRG